MPGRHSRGYLICIHVAAVFMALVILLPFAWLLISSVSPPADLVSSSRAVASRTTIGQVSATLASSAAGTTSRRQRSAPAWSTASSSPVTTVLISLAVGVFGATRSRGCGSGSGA